MNNALDAHTDLMDSAFRNAMLFDDPPRQLEMPFDDKSVSASYHKHIQQMLREWPDDR